MSIEKTSHELPEIKLISGEAQNMQEEIVSYLSRGNNDYAKHVINEAKNRGITLDLDTAVKQSIKEALPKKYILGSVEPENFESILQFAKDNGVVVDLTSPDLKQAVEDCCVFCAIDHPYGLAEIMSIAERNHLIIERDVIYTKAIMSLLKAGAGETANRFWKKIEKGLAHVDFSSPDIAEALNQGLESTLREGEATDVNRLIHFAQRANIDLKMDDPKFIQAAKEGLIKTLLKMRLGPGAVSFAEQMVKLIRKYKMPVNLKSSEVEESCKKALTKGRGSQTSFTGDFAMFSSAPHIIEFAKKLGIKLE